MEPSECEVEDPEDGCEEEGEDDNDDDGDDEEGEGEGADAVPVVVAEGDKRRAVSASVSR